MSRVFLSVGSNIAPAEHLRDGVSDLGHMICIRAVSTVVQTVPIGPRAQPVYYNAVLEVSTELPPRTLKYEILRPLEERQGRTRCADKYAPRPLDLDILLYGDLVCADDDLVLPDPEISARAFLAHLLCELAPELVLPGTDRTISSIARTLPATGMTPLVHYTRELRILIAGLSA